MKILKQKDIAFAKKATKKALKKALFATAFVSTTFINAFAAGELSVSEALSYVAQLQKEAAMEFSSDEAKQKSVPQLMQLLKPGSATNVSLYVKSNYWYYANKACEPYLKPDASTFYKYNSLPLVKNIGDENSVKDNTNSTIKYDFLRIEDSRISSGAGFSCKAGLVVPFEGNEQLATNMLKAAMFRVSLVSKYGEALNWLNEKSSVSDISLAATPLAIITKLYLLANVNEKELKKLEELSKLDFGGLSREELITIAVADELGRDYPSKDRSYRLGREIAKGLKDCSFCPQIHFLFNNYQYFIQNRIQELIDTKGLKAYQAENKAVISKYIRDTDEFTTTKFGSRPAVKMSVDEILEKAKKSDEEYDLTMVSRDRLTEMQRGAAIARYITKNKSTLKAAESKFKSDFSVDYVNYAVSYCAVRTNADVSYTYQEFTADLCKVMDEYKKYSKGLK